MSSASEKTFRAYSKEQGQQYARNRLDYHPTLYNTIIAHHTTTGGQLDTIIDVGCGPGTAVAHLSQHFNHAIGLDPSAGMIATARSQANTTSTGEAIRFEISAAEDLGSDLSPPIPDASVDLIVAATAAHWFDMPRFWKSAARVLRPGGSVALWAAGDMRVHPSMPNAEAIQAAADKIEEEYLGPHFLPGNLLTRGRYEGLGLPWSVEPAVEGFNRASFYRKDWDVADEDFYLGGQPETDLETFEKMVGTMSPVTRWREANPEAVGTEGDVVRVLRRTIERLLTEAGVEDGKKRLKGATQGVLLIVKRDA